MYAIIMFLVLIALGTIFAALPAVARSAEEEEDNDE